MSEVNLPRSSADFLAIMEILIARFSDLGVPKSELYELATKVIEERDDITSHAKQEILDILEQRRMEAFL